MAVVRDRFTRAAISTRRCSRSANHCRGYDRHHHRLLAAHLPLAAVIGQWQWDEWGHEEPAFSAQDWSQRLVEAAGVLGHPALYLQTEIPEFYAKLGWDEYARERYLGDDVVVMVRDLR